MTDRRRRIVLLLGSRADLDPAPYGCLRTTAGMAPTQRVACPDCGATQTPGWIEDRYGKRSPCQTCGGRITKTGRHVRGRGRVMVDGMDTFERRPIRTVTDNPTKPPRMVDCDACAGEGTGRWHIDQDTGREWRDPCVYCAGSGKRPKPTVTPDPTLPDERDTLAEATRKQGSYDELDHALEALPERLRRIVLDVHARVPARTVGPLGQAMVDEALVRLDGWMPDPIRVPGIVFVAARNEEQRRRNTRGRAVGVKALADRDRLIRVEARRGRPVQWLAQHWGLSVRQVYRVIHSEHEEAA